MKDTRAYYIDWLRIIIVALLIPHHTAITFSHLGDAYVYLPVKDDALYFFIQSTFLNLWFMRVLFFISGISTFYALQKRTNKDYFMERCKRLLLPAVFAVIVLCPAMGYFKAITADHFTGSFFSFYPIFFKEIVHYLGWGHFWFLVYLFVFSLIFLMMRQLIKNIDPIAGKIGIYLSQRNRILLPIFIFVLLEMILRPFYPGFQTLINDWANFAIYLGFFLFGYVVATDGDCMDAIASKICFFAVVSCISAVSFIFLQYAQENISLFTDYYQDRTYVYELGLAFFRGVAEYALVLLAFGVGKLYLNKDNQLFRYLSKTSFSLYMFHFLIVNAVMYFAIQLPWNHFILYFVSIILVYSLFFILYELIIKRIRPLRYLCGIK